MSTMWRNTSNCGIPQFDASNMVDRKPVYNPKLLFAFIDARHSSVYGQSAKQRKTHPFTIGCNTPHWQHFSYLGTSFKEMIYSNQLEA